MTSTTPTLLKRNEGEVLRTEEKDLGKSFKAVLLDVTKTDGGATFTFNLNDYNLSKLLGIRGITHITANESLLVQAPTTSVASGVVTVTVGGTTGQKKRSYIIIGEEN